MWFAATMWVSSQRWAPGCQRRKGWVGEHLLLLGGRLCLGVGGLGAISGGARAQGAPLPLSPPLPSGRDRRTGAASRGGHAARRSWLEACGALCRVQGRPREKPGAGRTTTGPWRGLEGLLPRAAGCRKKVPKLLQVRPASRERGTQACARACLPLRVPSLADACPAD